MHKIEGGITFGPKATEEDKAKLRPFLEKTFRPITDKDRNGNKSRGKKK